MKSNAMKNVGSKTKRTVEPMNSFKFIANTWFIVNNLLVLVYESSHRAKVLQWVSDKPVR